MHTESKRQSFHLGGYYPGVVGQITACHAVYYHQFWGFDASFETQVGRELSEFIARFDPLRDGFWSATVKGGFAGSIAIDGHPTATDGARLRWFIVAPEYQGYGIGKALMATAIQFSRTSTYPQIYLWTFEGLDVARELYERNGFRLTAEHQVRQWGRNLNEQQFVLVLDPKG